MVYYIASGQSKRFALGCRIGEPSSRQTFPPTSLAYSGGFPLQIDTDLCQLTVQLSRVSRFLGCSWNLPLRIQVVSTTHITLDMVTAASACQPSPKPQ